MEDPPPLHGKQGGADHPAPNWVLQESKEFAIEYQQVHGKPPIGKTKSYEGDEYVYKVKFHHNQKGEVDRKIKKRYKGNLLLELLVALFSWVFHILRMVLGGIYWVIRYPLDQVGRPTMGLGNRATCPNCHRHRRRYDSDKFLKCHQCGWVIGWPGIRWIRYPTWIQYACQRVKDRRGSSILGALLGLPYLPLRLIDPEWWRVLPYKRQHTLTLGVLVGMILGYVIAEPTGAREAVWTVINWLPLSL